MIPTGGFYSRNSTEKALPADLQRFFCPGNFQNMLARRRMPA
jgi:hypothetical protein